ncbi:MAG TPA: endonuclease/exonuclease/phosphatase family protein [Bacteroidota bacterium]
MHIRRILLLASTIIVGELAFGMVPEVSTKNDSLHLKVMTFNIRYGTASDGEDQWEKRKEMLFELLMRYSPDIIGVQEALRFQLDEIRHALPEYAEVGRGRDDGKTGGEYSAILFRVDRFTSLEEETFWFSDTPTVPGSVTWGNSFPRICTWTRIAEKMSGRSFYVYNVHLDHVSQASREKSVATLAQKLRSREHSDPVIVTGDFNAGEKNRAIQFLKGQESPGVSAPNDERIHLVDSYRCLHPHETAVGTFHAFSGNRGGEKIDFIFVERGTTVVEAAILHNSLNGRYPSDHFPVTARIVLPPP